MRCDGCRVFIAVLFVSALVTSNFTASKVACVELPFIGYVFFPAAVLAYALTFLFTDIYSEVYGRDAAERVVIYGFFAMVFATFLAQFSVVLPPAPFHVEYQETFAKVFGAVPSIVIGSLIAYLVSQTHDVYAFHFWRKVTRGKHLWLRNNASTIASQFIDTVTFITLAFWAIPKLLYGEPIVGLEHIPRLILGQYIIKVIIAVCDTPFCYLGVYLVRRWCGGSGKLLQRG